MRLRASAYPRTMTPTLPGASAGRARFFALLCLGAAFACPEAARADDDVHPALRMGIGPQYATSPKDRMLTGQTVLALDIGFGGGGGTPHFTISPELAYTGERRGRLAGRHLMAGFAIRIGGAVGLGILAHGFVGRTRGLPGYGALRSGGIRVGGRVDAGRVAGVDIQYEHRAIRSVDAERGFRMVFWIDPIFVVKVAAHS